MKRALAYASLALLPGGLVLLCGLTAYRLLRRRQVRREIEQELGRHGVMVQEWGQA